MLGTLTAFPHRFVLGLGGGGLRVFYHSKLAGMVTRTKSYCRWRGAYAA